MTDNINMKDIRDRFVAFLRWSEKYTKTDMIYLARSGSWLGLGQFVATGAAFITSVAFANLLPPETYGVYKYILSITSIILVSTLTGMDSAVAQSAARGFEGALSAGVKTKMKWGVLGTLVSLLIAGYYYTQGNLELSLAFCIVSIFVPFSESFDLYNSLLWGKKLFSVQTRYNIIRKLLSLIIIVGILFITKNIFAVLFAYFISLTVPAGLFLWQTAKKHLANKKIDQEMVRYGKNLSAISLIGLVVWELDKILVFHYLGAVNLAVYALATAPTDQIKGLLKNLNSLSFPQFALKDSGEIKRTIWRKVWMLVLIVSLIVIGYIVAAPFFFGTFFPKYLASVRYSQILSLSLIPAVVGGFLYSILESKKYKAGMFKYNLYGFTFSIVTLLPLLYYFGIWGAITSRILSRFFFLLLVKIYITKMD